MNKNHSTHEILKRLKAIIDSETKLSRKYKNPLILLGNPDSVFINILEKKAKSFGFNVVRRETPIPRSEHEERPGNLYIADEETFKSDAPLPFPWINLDNEIYLPAVSEAILSILPENLEECKVAVIGRGYTAKPLFGPLVGRCNSITYVNSKTKSIWSELLDTDIVIICSPKLDCGIPFSTSLVIDIGGALEGKIGGDDSMHEYIGRGEIGGLTTSILLHRYSEYGSEVDV